MKISEIVYKKKTLIDFGYLNGNKCFNLPDVCEWHMMSIVFAWWNISHNI